MLHMSSASSGGGRRAASGCLHANRWPYWPYPSMRTALALGRSSGSPRESGAAPWRTNRNPSGLSGRPRRPPDSECPYLRSSSVAGWSDRSGSSSATMPVVAWDSRQAALIPAPAGFPTSNHLGHSTAAAVAGSGFLTVPVRRPPGLAVESFGRLPRPLPRQLVVGGWWRLCLTWWQDQRRDRLLE